MTSSLAQVRHALTPCPSPKGRGETFRSASQSNHLDSISHPGYRGVLRNAKALGLGGRGIDALGRRPRVRPECFPERLGDNRLRGANRCRGGRTLQVSRASPASAWFESSPPGTIRVNPPLRAPSTESVVSLRLFRFRCRTAFPGRLFWRLLDGLERPSYRKRRPLHLETEESSSLLTGGLPGKFPV